MHHMVTKVGIERLLRDNFDSPTQEVFKVEDETRADMGRRRRSTILNMRLMFQVQGTGDRNCQLQQHRRARQAAFPFLPRFEETSAYPMVPVTHLRVQHLREDHGGHRNEFTVSRYKGQSFCPHGLG